MYTILGTITTAGVKEPRYLIKDDMVVYAFPGIYGFFPGLAMTKNLWSIYDNKQTFKEPYDKLSDFIDKYPEIMM